MTPPRPRVVREPCTLCRNPESPAVRRGLCWTCHRKMRQHCLRMPEPAPAGGPHLAPGAALAAWLREWPAEARARLAAALAEVDAA